MLGWAFAEYLARLVGGIPMSQGEIVRPRDLGLGEGALAALSSAEVQALMAEGGTRRATRPPGRADRRRRARRLGPG